MKAALYARYSTEKQSGASIEDQLRDCARNAERHGFTVVARFSDAAISGGTTHRPGYQDMLTAARRHEFDVIVAEDTSRLWRNLAEQAPRLAELLDLGIHVVTHDLDTRHESAGMLSAVLGASSEAYRKEIGRRTRRGLEGIARAGGAAGGKCYGYDSQRVIVESEATIVREIFNCYAAGASQKAIAADLNVRGVPAPGASWKRVTRRHDGKWLVSGVHTILRNPLYAGTVIWNKASWKRSATDSKKRRRVLSPQDLWIVRQDGSVRIIEQAVWDRVQARRGAGTGYRSPNARPKFLLSGLLTCGECGASMILTGGRTRRYVCGSRHGGGAAACGNGIGVSRILAEELIVDPLRKRLFDKHLAQKIEQAKNRPRSTRPRDVSGASALVKGCSGEAPIAPIGVDPRAAEVERLVQSGVMSAAEARPILARLHAAHNSVTQAPTEPTAEALERLREAMQSTVMDIVREALRELVGRIRLVPKDDERGPYLEAVFDAADAMPLLAWLSFGEPQWWENAVGSGGPLLALFAATSSLQDVVARSAEGGRSDYAGIQASMW